MRRIKEFFKKFHKNESGAIISTEVIIFICIGLGVALVVGLIVNANINKTDEGVTNVMNQLDDFQNNLQNR